MFIFTFKNLQAPLPPPNWTDIFEAVDKGIICPQPDFGTEIFVKKRTMQENCLILNIYVPDTEENNLSVVVFIHGGAFQVGAGNRRKALTLMQSKRIITVTFNYRLGVIGFLCLGTKDVPGNAGLKDIVAMLRWLRKNISSFGGNPNDITVSGYSSGAVAADLLILSKSAKGLFNKVIIESGSNLAEFAIQLKPLDIAKTYARTLNFTNVDDIFFLEKFYKSLLYHKLTEEAYVYRKDSSFVFVPCVERDVGEEMFLHDTPMNILKSGDYIKVPMLYGFTNMEGLVRVPVFDFLKPAMNLNFTDFLPPDLEFDSDQERDHITKQVKEFYFTEKPIDDNSILAYVDYITDVMFTSPALRSVSLNVAGGNRHIYLYYYSFTDENDPYVAHTTVRGANHCAQSLAVFDDAEPKNITTKFVILRKIIRKMWYGFITTGLVFFTMFIAIKNIDIRCNVKKEYEIIFWKCHT